MIRYIKHIFSRYQIALFSCLMGVLWGQIQFLVKGQILQAILVLYIEIVLICILLLIAYLIEKYVIKTFK